MNDIFYFDVFESGDGIYPVYRIPALITTKKGTLLAFSEGRQKIADQARNDIVMRRSLDGGETWSSLQVVSSMGEDALNNPMPVVVNETGRIILFFQKFPYPPYVHTLVPGHDDPGGKKIAIPFLKRLPKRVVKAYMVVSDDDGYTWSEPIDITHQVKRKRKVTSISGGPGIGIQLEHGKYSGRLVMPFNEGYFNGLLLNWNVYAVYSDDQGKTWQMGDIAPIPKNVKGFPNEVQMVELSDGSLLLNARVEGGSKMRMVSRSEDGGETWSPLSLAPTLVDPHCQGSIIRYPGSLNGRESRILFSNPASRMFRTNGTVRLSEDDGRTWPISRVLCSHYFSYSCLTTLQDGSIGCLFETHDTRKRMLLRFARFSLDWLLDKRSY
ncbi:MAG: sialidase family protein [Promethearchaeota archaeon]